MIDIHCHILPAIDDGAEDAECGLQMARQAVAEGIHTIIATPHHGNGRYENEREQVVEAVEKWNAILQEHAVPLRVLPGQEVHLRREWLDDLANNRLLSLNGSRYILLELQTHRMPDSLVDLLHELQVVGLQPIIAHPERHPVFMKNPILLRDWMDAGALFQLTSHSITGDFGSKIREAAQYMIKNRLVHFIASDAHHPKYRQVTLRAAYAEASRLAGTAFADFLKGNAEAVVANTEIVADTVQFPRKKWFNFF